jgi:hypothetical protein
LYLWKQKNSEGKNLQKDEENCKIFHFGSVFCDELVIISGKFASDIIAEESRISDRQKTISVISPPPQEA